MLLDHILENVWFEETPLKPVTVPDTTRSLIVVKPVTTMLELYAFEVYVFEL